MQFSNFFDSSLKVSEDFGAMIHFYIVTFSLGLECDDLKWFSDVRKYTLKDILVQGWHTSMIHQDWHFGMFM